MNVDRKKLIKPEIWIPRRELARIYGYIQELIDDLPESIPALTVSEFAAEHRILPRGTPFPGPWRNDRTPYLVDIMDDLSANSPTREVVFAKSAQVGATAGPIENWIGYIIKCVPGPALFSTANEKLLAKWTAKRLSPLLISCGLDGKIGAQHLMKGARATGNKQFSKEFPGGSLEMVTAGSAANLRSDSIRYLIMDEVDGYSWDISGEGNPVAVAKARTKAWPTRKKILYVSTPTTEEGSHIWPMYLDGDQRKYLVPCPRCGGEQELVFGDEKSTHGFKWDTEAGMLDKKSVHYVCDHCREPIFEDKKFGMITAGRWEASSLTSAPDRHSYHIWAAYSLMEKWSDIVQEHIDTEGNERDRRGFVNTTLGLPYRETGTRPDVDAIINVSSSYEESTAPDEVLFITAGVDVQSGGQSERTARKNPARLEMEICGHGEKYTTYSIAYLVFEGAVDDPEAGAWKALTDFRDNGGFSFERSDGSEMPVSMMLIDSGDGNLTSVVYDFCRTFKNTFPSKGQTTVHMQKYDKDDEETEGNFKRYGMKKVDEDLTLYNMSTNFYKRKLYTNLKIERQEPGPQKMGFCGFPRQYTKKYFKMLTAEELKKDGSFHCPSGRRNEALDVRVMNMCAGNAWVDMLVRKFRKTVENNAVANGRPKPSQFDLARIDAKYVIEHLKKRTALRN